MMCTEDMLQEKPAEKLWGIIWELGHNEPAWMELTTIDVIKQKAKDHGTKENGSAFMCLTVLDLFDERLRTSADFREGIAFGVHSHRRW
jgi:hypothetical protein